MSAKPGWLCQSTTSPGANFTSCMVTSTGAWVSSSMPSLSTSTLSSKVPVVKRVEVTTACTSGGPTTKAATASAITTSALRSLLVMGTSLRDAPPERSGQLTRR
jgi:hypothetical protein